MINQQTYTQAVFVSTAGVITYVQKNPNPAISTVAEGLFTGTPTTGVGAYNANSAFIFVGSTRYDFSQVLLDNGIINVWGSNANGQVVGQTSCSSTAPAYLGTPIH